MSVTSTIKAGTGPEGILVSNNKIWVANGGGFTVDSTVLVIDPVTDNVIKTIFVGHNPKELVEDANGNIWVLCYGYIQYDTDWNISVETLSKLVKISSSDYSVQKEIVLAAGTHPFHLDIRFHNAPKGELILDRI